MSTEKRKEFLKWHEENKLKTFNLQQELINYCKLDVRLLADGILAFRKIILDLCNIDPFCYSSTIASLAFLIYRQKHMIKDSIAVIPEIGYNPFQKTSNKARLWIRFYSYKFNLNIR